MLLVHIFIILLITALFLFMAEGIAHKLLFKPKKIDKNELISLKNEYKNNIEVGFINNKMNNNIIQYALVNLNKVPSFEDEKIIFFCHGNTGWLGDIIKDDGVLQRFFKDYTIFIFDYSGYGMTTGITKETNIYLDTQIAYNFLLSKSKFEKIILVGFSLGTSIISNLIYNLKLLNYKVPKKLILISPFYSLIEISNDIVPLLGYLTDMKFTTNLYLKEVENETDIYIIHSKEDELINFNHGKKLNNEIRSNLIEILGSHTKPNITDNIKDQLKIIINI
jgi:predicted esterase